MLKIKDLGLITDDNINDMYKESAEYIYIPLQWENINEEIRNKSKFFMETEAKRNGVTKEIGITDIYLYNYIDYKHHQYHFILGVDFDLIEESFNYWVCLDKQEQSEYMKQVMIPYISTFTFREIENDE